MFVLICVTQSECRASFKPTVLRAREILIAAIDLRLAGLLRRHDGCSKSKLLTIWKGSKSTVSYTGAGFRYGRQRSSEQE